jgi:diguanylate cyclase (GGDEF)-like protein/PAS domain S-box-containing protein
MKSNSINKKISLISSEMEALFTQAGIGILVANEALDVQFINQEALNIFEYKREEMNSINIFTLFHKSVKIKLQNKLQLLKKLQNYSSSFELIGLHKNSTPFPLEISITLNQDKIGTTFTIILRDITSYRKKEDELKHQAYFDQLTGIPNRTLLFDRAENALNQAIRAKEKLALIFIDLDGFKNINDKYGHETGDIFLKRISQRFINSARKSDTVSRIGGDEFIILMPRIINTKDAANLAERIIESNTLPININNNLLFPMASIGISVYPEDGSSIEELLKKSDKAMYNAKRLGKNKYLFYKNC